MFYRNIFASEERKTTRKLFYIFLIAVAFGLVYAGSLIFVYIEGDDASTVIFHAMGRHPNLQRPYSPYHGMMDLFLSALPPDETLIRQAAMTVSAVSAPVFVILLLCLFRQRFPEIADNFKSSLSAVIILLASPELFYFGLVYTPSITAMCFVLTAHLLIGKFQQGLLNSSRFDLRNGLLFFGSAAFFGIGVACRWDIGTYLIVIATDLFLGGGLQGERGLRGKNFTLGVIWGILAVILTNLMIFVSGYETADIYQALIMASREAKDVKSWFTTIGAFQTLFTPAFAILFTAGLYSLIRRKNLRLILLILVGILPVLPYLLSREPKMFLPAFPGMLLAVTIGVNRIFFERQKDRYSGLKKNSIIILLIIPWLVGVQIDSPETVWGAGFEIGEVQKSLSLPVSEDIVSSRVADRRVGIRDVRVRFADGFAVPTPEGARPLGGHAFVLLTGKWRQLADKLNSERQRILELAITENLTVVQDGGNALLTAKLLENGFNTTDSMANFQPNGINKRVFSDLQGRNIKVLTLQRTNSFFEKEMIDELSKICPNEQIILFSGNSSTFIKLNKIAPASFTPTGSFSAVLSFENLAEQFRAKE